MPMYADLSEAVTEIVNHIDMLSDLSALIIKTNWDEETPYLPVYVLHMGGDFDKEFKQLQNSSPGNVIAIFASIR